MKVTQVTSEILRIPIRHEGSLGVGKLFEIENVLVRVETDAGLVGIGESSPWPVFAENCWAVKAALDHYLAPCLVGENPFDLERLLLKMDRHRWIGIGGQALCLRRVRYPSSLSARLCRPIPHAQSRAFHVKDRSRQL